MVGVHLLGQPRSYIEATPLKLYVRDKDRAAVDRHFKSVFEDNLESRIELHISTPSGRELPVILRSSPVMDRSGTVIQCQTAMMDISEHKETEEQLRKAKEYLEHLAHHDPLTGFPNRLLFNDRLRVALTHARRSGKKVAVLFMDIDRFKFINDSLGHHVGDELLCEFARRIRSAIREEDTVARLGGDEFTVILENIENPTDVTFISRKIARSVCEPIQLHGNDLCVTTSIGVCMYPTDARTPEDMMKFADAAMYRAKEQGRNAIQYFTPALNAEVFNRVSLERDVREALISEQFALVFQPQFETGSNRIVAVEALLRWHHPERGTLTPDQFITIAEESGHIERIGEWVLDEACEHAKRWCESSSSPVRVAVNISAKQFTRPGLEDVVRRALARTGLPPHCLELELTESSLLTNPDVAISTLEELRAMGVQVAIDDFGTGYSSLSRIRGLPISRLKIDSSFVQGIPTSLDDQSIASAIISMAHSLGLEVVSEGIETQPQQEFLAKQKCDLLQGFHLARPMDAEAMATLLFEQSRRTFLAAASA